jgi:hypothetical protein
MPIKVGYWRSWPSGPKKQRETLEAAGCEKIYGEASPKMAYRLVERYEAIRTLRPGDELVVVEAQILGRNQAEVLEALTEAHRVSEGGAAIRDLETGEVVKWSAEAQGPLDFVTRAVTAQNQGRRRAAGEAARGRAGRKKALEGKRHAAAKADWFNPEMSGAQVAEKYGITVQTLTRYFGGRMWGSS